MYQLQVEEMSCGHCVSTVTQAVQALDPGARVAVDLATKTVSVDSGVELARIRSAIADAGFPVSSAV